MYTVYTVRNESGEVASVANVYLSLDGHYTHEKQARKALRDSGRMGFVMSAFGQRFAEDGWEVEDRAVVTVAR